MSAVINISYAHSTICCCFYCIHISFFIITLQRYVLFPTPPNFSPFFSSAIRNQPSVITPLPFAPPRPRRINTRTSCVKYSQLCCVDNHEQPQRGESLLASTGPAGQALSPHLLRRGGFRRGGGASPSRRGRVR